MRGTWPVIFNRSLSVISVALRLDVRARPCGSLLLWPSALYYTSANPPMLRRWGCTHQSQMETLHYPCTPLETWGWAVEGFFITSQRPPTLSIESYTMKIESMPVPQAELNILEPTKLNDAASMRGLIGKATITRVHMWLLFTRSTGTPGCR